ncbi:unnamed protein product [Soboliphyme baturini]|uniref:DH domain-containing protein n=1 Tax=Soboliphyme baturini TaxID=241478 RepID=A0A183J3N9_9BILA|nr:unnamed protein product [Soboliphyme baturini]
MEDKVCQKKKVYDELLASEQSYADHLDLLIRNFVDPLLRGGFVSSHEISCVFGDIKSIRVISRLILDRLQCSSDIVHVFDGLVPFFKFYLPYARNYPSSQQRLEWLRSKNSKFNEFCCQRECLPELKGLKLPALLITPIQRIPRYGLLLESYCKLTDEQSGERRNVENLLQQIDDMIKLIEQQVEDHENSTKVIAIQKGLDKLTPNLVSPGRRFLKEGTLSKMCRPNNVFHVRMFWLFTDMLVYGKRKSRNSSKYSCSGVIPLNHCCVKKSLNKNVFRLVCKDKVLFLSSEHYADLSEWMDAIDGAIQ